MIGDLEASVVRIFDPDGRIAGAGCLVSDRHVLTCAHVVCRALGVQDVHPDMPEAVLHVDFPLAARGTTIKARTIFWRPASAARSPSPGDIEDVAALELLTDPPPSSRPCRLVTSKDLWGHGFRAFGFPSRRDEGVWATGVLRGRQAAGWVQIEDIKEAGYRVEPGFSGAPVWDENLGGIVGMAVAAEGQPDVRAAFIIPTEVLLAACPALAEQLVLSRERSTNMGPQPSRPWVSRYSAKDSSMPSEVSPSRWPLVGRTAERTYVAEAIATGRAGIVLAGQPGVGKTRLALEALREAEEQGCWTTWAVATRAGASIPFGPFAHLLPQTPSGSLSRLDLVRQIGERLVAHAAGRRVVVGVDDSHLLDDASAALVHQLAVSGSAFVLVTLRSGEEAPDSIIALWKDGLAERLELKSLPEREIAELVSRVLGGQVDAPTVSRLWEATRGNALFLRELVLAGLEEGVLTEAGGVWSFKGLRGMSLRLQEMVAARLGTLDADQIALLEVVAYGEPIPVHRLEALVSSTALEAAERRGIIAVEEDGRRMLVRMAHPLYSEAVRARCPKLRARRVYRQLAAALEATGARRSEDMLRLATFRLEAGEGGDPNLLLAGAQRARAAFDLELSERLARAAADAGGGLPAKLAVAQALIDEGCGAEAARLLSEGDDDPHLTDSDRAAAALLRAHGVWIGLGQPLEAKHILERAEEAVCKPDLRDELRAAKAGVLCFSGHPNDSILIFEALEEEDAENRACVRAAIAAVLAYGVVGRTEEGVTAAKRWIGPARHLATDLPFTPFQLTGGESLALCVAGELVEAGLIAEKAHREAIARNAEHAIAFLACARGIVALAQGEMRRAIHWLREATTGLRNHPSRNNHLPLCLAVFVQAAVLNGDLGISESSLAEAEASMTAGVALWEPMLDVARAWLAAGHLEMGEAQKLALLAADRADASGQKAIAAMALHDLARFGDPQADRLAHIASRVDGPFAPACAAHAGALVARDGCRLDDVAVSFAEMGAHLLAAEAAAEAATVHDAEGQQQAMVASSARARRYLDACEGVRPLAFSALATYAGGGQ